MCGRYLFYNDKDDEELRKIVKKIQLENGSYKNGEIFPTDNVPVIIKNTLTALKWGYTLYNNKPIINARVETIKTKKLFMNSFNKKRCLIPANAFYEWKSENNKKIKHSIKVKNSETFFMAGLYNSFVNKNGDKYFGFVIITLEPTEEISKLHNRMPLIIGKDYLNTWLNDEELDINQIITENNKQLFNITKC